MPRFTIVYNDNSTKNFEAENKDSLIRDFSIADPTAFQNDVKEIRWDDKSNFFIECILCGKISKTPKK